MYSISINIHKKNKLHPPGYDARRMLVIFNPSDTQDAPAPKPGVELKFELTELRSKLVPGAGLEPAWLSPYGPRPYLSRQFQHPGRSRFMFKLLIKSLTVSFIEDVF